MSKIFDLLTGSTSSNRSALATVYHIHGDGVATMIPKEMIKRPKFQENIAAIRALDLGQSDDLSENGSDNN